MSNPNELVVYTIGHSTLSLDEFIDILNSFKINLVVDVRTVPHSKHNPKFNRNSLSETLKTKGIKYILLPELGGLRRPRENSVNLALKNKSFQGYADFMQTKEFSENLLKLIALTRENQLVIMCAEAVPWRCHRTLLSDALSIRKFKVKHILNENNYINHEINPLVQIEGTKISYTLFFKQKAQRSLSDFGKSP